MDVERLYSAEQIVVPPALPSVIKKWTKEVIRANPDDIVAFSAQYFARLTGANPDNATKETEDNA